MNEWKDVRDQLPDTETTVLIACPDADEPVWLGYLDVNDQWRTCSDMLLLHPVTHWMHLPELPRESKR